MPDYTQLHEWQNYDYLTVSRLNNWNRAIEELRVVEDTNINYSKVATLSVVSSPLAVAFAPDGNTINYNTIVLDYNCPLGSGRIQLANGALEFTPSASIWIDTDPRAVSPIVVDSGFPDIADTTKWWIGQMIENYGERVATAGIFRVTWKATE